jgi:dynein heavy chain 1
LNDALKQPILFSDWLARHYTSIDEEELRQYIQQRLKVICRNFYTNYKF